MSYHFSYTLENVILCFFSLTPCEWLHTGKRIAYTKLSVLRLAHSVIRKHVKRDMSIAGEIYRRMLPMFQSESEEDRLTAAKAFRVGLAALEGRDIDV